MESRKLDTKFQSRYKREPKINHDIEKNIYTVFYGLVGFSTETYPRITQQNPEPPHMTLGSIHFQHMKGGHNVGSHLGLAIPGFSVSLVTKSVNTKMEVIEMKKTVKLFAVSLVIIVIIAAGIRIANNKIEEAYNIGFEAGIEHTINDAIIWVAKVANGGYNIHIEINGNDYVHFASELAEEVE